MGFTPPPNWDEKLKVRDMNDGGMGSLRLYVNGIIGENCIFGQQISEYEFSDADGTLIIASLYLDKNGALFELDVWKTDFGKLLRLP